MKDVVSDRDDDGYPYTSVSITNGNGILVILKICFFFDRKLIYLMKLNTHQNVYNVINRQTLKHKNY